MRQKSLMAIILGIVLILAVSLLAIDTGRKQNEMHKDYAKAQLQNASELISKELELYLSGHLEVVDILASMAAREEKESWNNEKLLDAVSAIAKKENFTNINICNTDGTGFDFKGYRQTVDFCPYYQKALFGDSSIAFSLFYKENKDMELLYTVPIYQEGKITGVLRASSAIGDVRKLMSVNTFRGKEEVYLLTQDGMIITDIAENAEGSGDVFSLMDKEEVNKAKLEQMVKQGKSLVTEMKFRKKVCAISFNGVKSFSDGSIMISIPRSELKGLFQPGSEKAGKSYLLVLLSTVIGTAILLIYFTVTSNISKFRIEKLAYYDEITDSISYNRFKKDASAFVHKAGGKDYALVVIAVDRFEYIKEFFGTQEGNKILKNIVKVLRENVKAGELYCRLNTDNMLLLLKCHSKDELTNRISYLNSKLLQLGEDPAENDKYEFHLHYGIYYAEETVADMDIMINRAIHALTLIKNDKSQPFEFYSGAMNDRINEEKEIEEHMFTALEEKEFLVYLQPKYDLNSGKQVGAEALVRWMHPDKGLLYPGRFIGVFEKNGFIVKLDMYILDTLCRRLKVWIGKGYRPMPLSINISRLNLFDENFINNVEATLEKYGVPANLIELEIAEEVVADNMELLSSLMERLKKYGFLISMDDFGTGTTSANTLYHVPVDELKLDRKFLLDAEKTDRGKNVIKSIIDMAKRLDIKVVSEGVESKAQARMLQELGCDMIQGFVFSDPLPVREYENYAYGPRSNENKIW